MSSLDTTDDLDAFMPANGDKADKDKGSKAKASSKVKDLSHVPCKFFRVGSCTAGSSCPFSHNMPEPGQPKDVCAWFVKGNCKFGHKCALAHVLPGQSMSMDRRNKKAAQAAAGQTGGGQQKAKEPEKIEKKKSQKPASPTTLLARSTLVPKTNGLLSGATAPTRVLNNGSRPPLPISKAVPAPAAPAPTLDDTDFASFELSKPVEKPSDHLVTDVVKIEVLETSPSQTSPSKTISPPTNGSFFPISTPTQPVRFTGRHGSTTSVDFGPVGSPPRSSPSNPIRINGFSPATSPREVVDVIPPFPPTTTFSAPGPTSQSLFMQFETVRSVNEPKGRSGLAASLGANQTFNVDPFSSISRNTSNTSETQSSDPDNMGEEDMEEFVPSSLKDLLTPEEQSRRMSRTSSATGNSGVPVTSARQGGQDNRHRYSHSVPALSAMANIKALWEDNSSESLRVPEDRGVTNMPIGTPSSYKSSSGLFPGFEELHASHALNPSNASAAFLPGLHHHYIAARASKGLTTNGGGPGLQSQMVHRNFSGPTHGDSNGLPGSPSRIGLPSAPFGHTSFDIFPTSPPISQQQPSGRPIPANAGLGSDGVVSPLTKALQAHAPGQSLPQGLAAGYSRIHLQPASTTSSPANSGVAFSPNGKSYGDMIGSPEWIMNTPSKHLGNFFEKATSPPSFLHSPGNGHSNPIEENDGGLSSMFSRLSYSAAAARSSPPSALSHSAGGVSAPMSMNRRSSGRGWNSHPLSSPLSGPVLTNDDDDLFSMDEEK